MTNKELKDEYEAICETIDVVGCYGTSDLRLREALEKEILKRGGEITTRTTVFFDEDIG